MKLSPILLAMLLFTLSTALSAGDARPTLPDDHPIAGDWNAGDNSGHDELGYYNRPTTSFVLCEDSESGHELTCSTFALDASHSRVVRQRAIPIVGRWEAGAHDTPGLYDPQTGHVELFHFVFGGTCGFQCLAAIVRTQAFMLGAGGDYPVAGDWDGNGIDSLGLVHPNGAFTLFDDSNSIPTHHIVSDLAPNGWIPMAGHWPENETVGDSLAFFEPRSGYFVPFDGRQRLAQVTFELRGPGTIPIPGAWKDKEDLPGLYFPKVQSPACRQQMPCHEVEWFPENFQSLFRETGEAISGTLNSRFPNDPSG